VSQAEWAVLLHAAIKSGALIQLVLSRPVQVSVISKVTVRPVQQGRETRYQWSFRRGPQEFHENLTDGELLDRVSASYGTKFADLHWFAIDADITVRQKPDGRCQIKRKPPTKIALPASHNRLRAYLLPEDVPCPFLQAIGVMSPSGQVHPTMYHKFRQINRYLEFLNDIYAELPASGTLQVVDFGCGKSYLTFAVHYYLTVLKSRTVEIVGLDRNRDVIDRCATIAAQLQLPGLRFTTGEIRGYQPSGSVHLAISLHACDTATDDALAHALAWNCDVIFAVPCCQHEISRLLPAETLSGLTGYGLLKERFAADVTDALRARFLETQGYRTQVVEFIELEHTPKNLLLRAVRRRTDTATQEPQKLAEYLQFKAAVGITDWHLEQAVASLANSSGTHGDVSRRSPDGSR